MEIEEQTQQVDCPLLQHSEGAVLVEKRDPKKPRTEAQKAVTRLMMEKRKESIALKKDAPKLEVIPEEKLNNKRRMIEDIVDSRFDFFEDRILHLLNEPFEKYSTKKTTDEQPKKEIKLRFSEFF